MKRARRIVDLRFPLRPDILQQVCVEVDFERQIIRFKLPGQRRFRQLALWIVYEQCEESSYDSARKRASRS